MATMFFADNTQERLNAILCKLNVQIPRMATRRICDTLDRLKQDILKLVLLRVGERERRVRSRSIWRRMKPSCRRPCR